MVSLEDWGRPEHRRERQFHRGGGGRRETQEKIVRIAQFQDSTSVLNDNDYGTNKLTSLHLKGAGPFGGLLR